MQHIVLLFAYHADMFEFPPTEAEIINNARKVGVIEADDKPHACDIAAALSDHKYTRIHAMPALKVWQPTGGSVILTYKQVEDMLEAYTSVSRGKPSFGEPAVHRKPKLGNGHSTHA